VALLVRIEPDEFAIAKHEPVDFSILHAPDDIFTDAAMPTKPGWRWHVNNPFDELGLLHPRHRVIAALELSTRQPVSILEG
jgi:hypothetical protein